MNQSPPNTVNASERPTDLPDDELLVAYLDGELPSDERKDLESRLIAETSLRTRLQELQRGWDLLAYLPSPVPDEKLVRTTLELVVADLTRDAPELAQAAGLPDDDAVTRQRIGQSRSRRRWQTAAVFMIALVTALVAGSWRSRSTRLAQQNDLPIAIDMDAYALGTNFELFRELQDFDTWQRIAQTGVDLTLGDPVPGRPWEARLQELPPDQRGIVASRWDRFGSMDQKAKQDLRDVAAAVAREDDAESLRTTMRLYARWRDRLSPDLIDEIESGETSVRNAAIAKAIRNSIDEMARLSGRNLNAEAVTRINFTLEQIVFQRLESQDEAMIRWRDRMSKFPGMDEKRVIQGLMALIVLDPDRWRRGFQRDIEKIPRPQSLTFEELSVIASMLPAADAAELESLASDTWIQAMILRQWTEEAVQREFRGQSEPRTTAERYLSTSPTERDVIDLLPPSEARERLQRSR